MSSPTYRKVLKEATCATILATVHSSNLGIELQQLGALFTKLLQATRSCLWTGFQPRITHYYCVISLWLRIIGMLSPSPAENEICKPSGSKFCCTSAKTHMTLC
jgi:hypothetical protein